MNYKAHTAVDTNNDGYKVNEAVAKFLDSPQAELKQQVRTDAAKAERGLDLGWLVRSRPVKYAAGATSAAVTAALAWESGMLQTVSDLGRLSGPKIYSGFDSAVIYVGDGMKFAADKAGSGIEAGFSYIMPLATGKPYDPSLNLPLDVTAAAVTVLAVGSVTYVGYRKWKAVRDARRK
ncbi:Uncharacterised protein [uncultured archaeon]|nr:Uncharacterised protein [uncultured archaeon]